MGNWLQTDGVRTGGWRRLAGFVSFILLCCSSIAIAAPSVSMIEASNITPASFAVSWISSLPSSGALNLFAADCTTPVSVSSPIAENSDITGFVRVSVSGLTADTAYCYQTVTTAKVNGETTVFPAQPLPLATAKAVRRTYLNGNARLPFANDLLQPPSVYLVDVTASQTGMLLLLDLADGSAIGPLSLLLTPDSKQNQFNLNNLFAASNGATINLSGGERLKITERQGTNGCSLEHFRLAPPDSDITRTAAGVGPPNKRDVDINSSVNILDILRVAAGIGKSPGSPCYNGDLDMTGDQVIDSNDLLELEVNLDATL